MGQVVAEPKAWLGLDVGAFCEWAARAKNKKAHAAALRGKNLSVNFIGDVPRELGLGNRPTRIKQQPAKENSMARWVGWWASGSVDTRHRLQDG